MHCTKRHLDRDRSLHGGAVVSILALVLAFAASCSDATSESEPSPEPDAGTDISSPGPDGSTEDVSPPSAPPVREVKCTEKPCAVGLSAASLSGAAFCALLDDGRVACWGMDDGSGVLGRSAPDGGAFAGVGLPALVENVSGAVALERTCALLGGGTVQCWGPGAGTLPFAGVTELAKGYTNRCAAVGPNAWSCIAGIYAPGPNGETTGTYPQRSFQAPEGAPLRQLFVGDAVANGGGLPADATFLVREDGSLLSSGARNFIGRETSLSPADPYFGEVALQGVTDLSVGNHVCAVANGKVHCWGSRVAKIHPDDPLPIPIEIPEAAVRVAAVGLVEVDPPEPPIPRLCAIGASGSVYCSGPNSAGQVGDGTRDVAYAAVPVKELPDPAVSLAATYTATCALVASGKVYCWGSGAAGAIGNGPAADALTPVLVQLP